jgi:hypothetical protein
MVKLAGATPKFVLCDDRTGFKLTPAQLEAAITPKTRLLVINSPSNPTGAVYTRAELEAIVAVAVKHNLYILSDEMYEHLIYDGAKPTCIATFSPEVEARTITVAGFSKTYAMTGWRIGTTVAPLPIAKAIAELQSQMSSNVTTFAQYGALAALKEKEKTRAALATMLTAFDRRRKNPPCRPEQHPGRELPAGPGRLLPVPERLQLRPQGHGILQPPARDREGRRRPRQRLRRRGLPASELRRRPTRSSPRASSGSAASARAERGDVFAALAPSAAVLARGEGKLRQLRPKPIFHVASPADPLVQFAWQERMLDYVLRLNGCGKLLPDAMGCTRYPSDSGCDVEVYLHDGGHQYPSATAPELIVKFFQAHPAR